LAFTVHEFCLGLQLPGNYYVPKDIYLGAVFRDRLGYLLKKRFCSLNDNRPGDCWNGCPRSADCPVVKFFKTLPENYSQPYAFAFPMIKENQSSVLPVSFRVYDGNNGLAQELYGHLWEALVAGEKIGLFKQEDPYKVFPVEENNREILAHNWQTALHLTKNISEDCVALSFVTPFRLKEKGGVCHQLTGEKFLLALLNRQGRLSRNWAGENLPVDFKELKASAKDITADFELRWGSVGQRGTKKHLGHSICFSGYHGKVTLRGNLTPWKPLLFLGQWTHIGRETVFGMGRYKIIMEDSI